MTSNEPTRLLKANVVRGLGSKVAFNYDDLRRRCDEYVEQVRAETRKMIQEAHTEAETIRRQAHEQGHKQGHRRGMRDAQQEIQQQARELADAIATEKLKTTLPAMQAAADALSQERDRWLAEWEAAAVRLSVAIAEKLLRHELSITSELSTEMLVEALELAAGQPHIRLRMHPDDIEHLGNYAEEVVRSMASCGEVSLHPDNTMSRGGCVIETQHGVIDARLETQLARITAELLQQ